MPSYGSWLLPPRAHARWRTGWPPMSFRTHEGTDTGTRSDWASCADVIIPDRFRALEVLVRDDMQDG
jgi:hypothetical protein